MSTRRALRGASLVLVVSLGLGATGFAGASAASAAAPVAAAPAAPAAPVAGGDTAGDSLFPGIGNTGYDVTHYDIDLTYLPDGSITAVTTIDATAPAPLSSFSLDFEGLTITGVDVDGAAASVTRTSDPSIDSYKLRITPSAPVSGTFETVVRYSGTPVTHTDADGSSEGWVPTRDGATAVGQPVGTMTWLPSDNTPSDKATLDLTLTVPTQIDGVDAAGVGNGVLVSSTPNGDGTTTWVWHEGQPMATELAVVSVGQFLRSDSTITLPSGRTIPETSFVDPTTSASDQAEIARLRAKLPEILGFLEKRYGPYPGDATGVIVDDTDLGYALETQDRPFFERSIDEETLIHELTHQWFGDSATPADWGDIWLNEGPATYVPTLYAEKHGGESAVTTWEDYWASVPASDDLWTVPPAGMTSPEELFGAQVYDRGAMTLAALRALVGTATFDRILREWIAENRGGTVSTADFIALASRVSGDDLDGFFDSWLSTAAKPAWPASAAPVPVPVPSPDPAPGAGAPAGSGDPGVAVADEAQELAATGTDTTTMGALGGAGLLLVLAGGAALVAASRRGPRGPVRSAARGSRAGSV